jgi:hypothetical protein
MRESTAFGVEIDGATVRVVQGKRRQGRFTWAVVSADDPAVTGELESGRTAVAGHLNPRESLTRWLNAPYSSVYKADQVLPTLLDVQLPFPLEQCVFAFPARTRTNTNAIRALAVAARVTEIKQRIDLYSTHHVDVTHLDQEGLALWSQALLDGPPQVDGTDCLRVLVHLANERWTLVIGRGRTFLAAHAVAPDDEAHVRRLIHAHIEDGNPQVVWLWSGSGATNMATVDTLYRRLSIRNPGPSQILAQPDSVLARALARRIIMPDPLACNLRRGPLLHDWMRTHEERKSRAPAVLLALGGALLCAAVLFSDIMVRRMESATDRRFNALAESLAGYRVTAKGRDAIRMVQQALGQRPREEDPFLEAAAPSHVARLAEIATIAEQNHLELHTVKLSSDVSNITGEAADWDAPATLQPALRSGPQDPILQRKEDLRRNRVTFVLTSQPAGGTQ